MAYASVKGPKVWKSLSHYCLGVSLGSKNHEGEALEAIVAWLNDAGFERGTIDLSDTLHRYNFMVEEGLSEEAARQKTVQASAEWLKEHGEILKQLKMPYDIISWDHWLSHPKFGEYLKLFQNAFRTQQDFRAAIFQDVGDYFSRRFDIGLSDARQQDIEHSVSFLIEELAAHSILYEEIPSATVYPGRQQASFKMVREGLVKNVPAGMQSSAYTRLTLHNFKDAGQTEMNDNLQGVEKQLEKA